jgi:hypothetical protein
MNRRPLIVFGTIAAVILGAFALFALTDVGPDGPPWDDDRQTVQTITHSDGTVDTVVIEHDGRPGFFPFFPIFPILAIVGVILLVRFLVGPGRGRGGPGGCGGPGEDRLREWHRREHERMGSESPTGA